MKLIRVITIIINYSFEYIDIILLAMIAGFIFLDSRDTWKKNCFEGRPFSNKRGFKNVNGGLKKVKENFDDEAQKEFLKGAKSYETVITDFGDNDNKITKQTLLNGDI